jgi:ribosomal protein S18 acetylase RimI-like enzyme
MRTCYIVRCGFRAAIADLIQHEGGMMITRINVPKDYRGKGYGRELLRQILVDADQEAITLHLHVSCSDGLTDQQLDAWYKRHGFVEKNCLILMREPRYEGQTNDESPEAAMLPDEF